MNTKKLNNRVNQFLQHFVTSKLFKVIFIDFLLKKIFLKFGF
jgi:hypothetical protein